MPHRELAVVLLVEDNPDDVFFMRTALEDGPARKQLHIVRDGAEALAFLRREPPHEQAPRPHLIILDLKLPKLSGIDVLDVIKSDASLRSIPVVVLTVSDTTEDALASYDRFATSVITKPQDLDDFKKVMHTLEAFWLQTVQLPRHD